MSEILNKKTINLKNLLFLSILMILSVSFIRFIPVQAHSAKLTGNSSRKRKFIG